MNTSLHPHIVALAAIVATLLLSPETQAKVSQETLNNLNAAFRGESNASHRYAAFAAKAEAEGFAQVARLFRATSASEAIHRDTHKKAILELGGTVATFELDEIKPGTTAENLEGAIAGETYERDTMYPKFLATAKTDDARAAIRTIEFARAAEKEHAKLYQDALANLGKNAAADYYVCQVCGMTVTELPEKRCPSCRQSLDEYRKIS
jgi:rubrerythrin